MGARPLVNTVVNPLAASPALRDAGPAPPRRAPPRLSCVIPCRNEAANLELLLPQLQALLARLVPAWEVILVDDGSTDATALRLGAWTRMPGVRALQLSRNFGKEAALTAGLDLVDTGAALILDADGQDPPGEDPGELFSVLDRDDVLTPHPGEFERIFPGLLAASPERITAAREAARRAGAVVLLKGPDTVVAAPDGRAAVSLNGTPWLATAGSGDVLAGFIGGLIAQGMESFEAACAAAWIHAEAGAAHGPGLIAEDLPDALRAVYRRLFVDLGVWP